MKTTVYSVFIAIAGASLMVAQVYTPPSTTTQPEQSTTTYTSKPASKPASPMGQEIPIVDFQAETITVGGVTIPLGDNRILKARFEKYLNQSPEKSEAAELYRSNIREILDTLSPFRSGGPNLSQAFKKLPAASSYPGDANICSTLAEAVYTSMLVKKDIEGLDKINQSIEDEKKDIIRKSDWEARHDKPSGLSEPTQTKPSGGEGSDKKPSKIIGEISGGSGYGADSLVYKESLKRIAEIEALKKTNVLKTEAKIIQTKAQYQVNMAQWFLQRRYEHTLMSARFYTQIWKDGDVALNVDKESDFSKLFSGSIGMNPTISTLDSLSNEIIHDVEKSINAINLMMERNELHSATQRLLEAFALGEYLKPVATFEYEKKQRVVKYSRDLNEIYVVLQAKDYAKGKQLVAALKQQAVDFPSSKIEAAITAYTLASDLLVEEAKNQLVLKQAEKASEKIREATEIWPFNPALDDFRKLIQGGGIMASVRADFERLLSENNYREIYKRQYEIAVAIKGDEAAEKAFEEIITNLMKIEGVLGKAAEFSKMGQNYAAYEQLASLRTSYPDDPKLGREIELLAPKVADFTKAIDQAEQLEKRQPRQLGSALAWYLNARQIYPQSDIASKAIDRLLPDVLKVTP